MVFNKKLVLNLNLKISEHCVYAEFSRLCLSLNLFVLNTMAEFSSLHMVEFLPSAMAE